MKLRIFLAGLCLASSLVGPVQGQEQAGDAQFIAAREAFRVGNRPRLEAMAEQLRGHVLADYRDPASTVLGVEFCGTSITSHAGKTDHSAEQLARNPHFLFADAQHRGYGLATFDANTLEVQLRGLDDVARKDSAIATLARFRVAAGTPRVERTG